MHPADRSFAPAARHVLDHHAEQIEQYRHHMLGAVDAVCAWLADAQAYSGMPIDELRRRSSPAFSQAGEGLDGALCEARELFLDHCVRVHHPHCAAHLHCPTLIASQAAEVLINAANQSLDSWDQSPSASLMELGLIEWLRDQIGFAPGDAGVLTSGGTQSNLMGLLLARDLLVKRVWGRHAQQDGLPADAHLIRVVCADTAHFSIQKNMALLGLGHASVVTVASNESGQIDIQALEQSVQRLLSAGYHIAAIVGTAGTTDAGAVDPLADLARIAASYGIWLHIDAAWGGALLMSRQYRGRLRGLELADSVTLDFHKAFLQPISCGAFVLGDARHFELMHAQAEYLNPASDEARGIPNLVSRSLQTTRRFDALKLWMSLRAVGLEQFGEMVDACIELAQQVARLIRRRKTLQLVMQPQLSSVLFRLAPVGMNAAKVNQLNETVANALLETGKANLGVTEYGGLTCLKLTLLNPATSPADIAALLDLIESEATAHCKLERAV